MKNEFLILIADRNRHVRDFLRRELMEDGYRVQVAKDGREVQTIIDGENPPDLLILDLEVPYVSGYALLEKLQNRTPPLPVVIHTFLTEYNSQLNGRKIATFVEKSGKTDCLKAAVMDMLKVFYPNRFAGDSSQNQRFMHCKRDEK